jgi:DNA-binding CsgD family transcriptional regulator
MLYGRAQEIGKIDQILAAARVGRSGAVIVVGDVGAGKTALLDYAATSAAGMRVLRITGVESESELPFAALHLLLRPALDRIDSLPAPQAAALRSALGMADAARADPFLVGLATLTLLAELSDNQPLLCVVDDAHWLDRDSAMALVFAARRMDAEGVALIFAAREEGRYLVSSGLPEVRLDALDQDAASQLLAECAADLDPDVRDRLIEDSVGNPLALIEFSSALSPEQRTGRVAPQVPHLGMLPVSRRVQDTFLAQISNLPARSRLVLLVAAADTTEDRDIVLRAAQTLGASADDLAPVETSRLILFPANGARFRHPLIRSVVYESASTPKRIAVHRALASALDREDQSYRRAWHLAASTTAPDENIAAIMESAARDARHRGGYAAAAAAWERAAQLSPDDRDRARRLGRAANDASVSGQMPHAVALAGRAAELTDDPLIVSRAAEVRASIAFPLESPRRSARICLEGAAAAGNHVPDMAARMLIFAVHAAFDGADPEMAVLAAQRLADMAVPPHLEAHARSAGGMALIMADDLPAGVEAMRSSLPALLKPERPRSPILSSSAVIHAVLAGDDQSAYDYAATLAQSCRTSGMTNDLSVVLAVLATAEQLRGPHASARAHALEALRIAEDTRQIFFFGYVSGMLARIAAINGDEQTCLSLADRAMAETNSPEMGWPGPGWAGWALGLLHLGLGRHQNAIAPLSELAAGPARNTHVGISALPDLVEASTAAGRPELGATALERFEQFSAAAGQPWASAVALRCRGILGDEPETNFAEAVRLHAKGGRPFERARTELLYGEWLRRARRRADARVNLQSAADIFDRLGAVPWADRARGELRATGAKLPARDRGPSPLSRLTPQELQVVRLAATGLSNRDIAAQLFLSPRTVGYHLYKAYPKLGISTRAQLSGLEFRE